MKTNIHFFIISRSFLLRKRNVLDKSCREDQNTHFEFSNFFFRISCHLWDNVEEYCRADQTTDDNMVHAYCLLDILRPQTHDQNM